MKDETSNCESFEILISAMLDNELDANEQNELESHLANCCSCQNLVQSYQQVNTMVDRLSVDWSVPEKLNHEKQHSLKTSGVKRFSIWRLIPLAAAAMLLVSFTIAAWPNPQPAKAEQISSDQFVEPMKEIQFLNMEKQRDQELMLRTLGMDLRSLKLELNQLEPGSPERQKFAEQIDAMIEKVRSFE